MRPRIIAYCKSIGLSNVVKDRLLELYGIYINMCPTKIDGVFVSDLRSKSDEQILDSAWFFSTHHVMESTNFLSELSLDIAPIRLSIGYAKIEAVEFDFKKATTQSRLTVHASPSTASNLSMDLKATGLNCNNLWNVYKTYFRPNVRTSG